MREMKAIEMIASMLSVRFCAYDNGSFVSVNVGLAAVSQSAAAGFAMAGGAGLAALMSVVAVGGLAAALLQCLERELFKATGGDDNLFSIMER